MLKLEIQMSVIQMILWKKCCQEDKATCATGESDCYYNDVEFMDCEKGENGCPKGYKCSKQNYCERKSGLRFSIGLIITAMCCYVILPLSCVGICIYLIVKDQ